MSGCSLRSKPSFENRFFASVRTNRFVPIFQWPRFSARNRAVCEVELTGREEMRREVQAQNIQNRERNIWRKRGGGIFEFEEIREAVVLHYTR